MTFLRAKATHRRPDGIVVGGDFCPNCGSEVTEISAHFFHGYRCKKDAHLVKILKAMNAPDYKPSFFEEEIARLHRS